MPIPENPQSRSEQYLNAIATGDNSGLPEFPQSRMEQYLEVIAQNGGGGGGGGGVFVVHVDENDTLDKTWQEIKDASLNGVVILVDENTTGYLSSCAYVPFSTPPTWTVKFERAGMPEPYATEDGADGYPIYSGE